MDELADLALGAQDAALDRPLPFAFPCDGRGPAARLETALADHAQVMHHAEHALDPHAHRCFVEAQPLSGLEDHHRHAGFARGETQRPLAQRGIEGHGRGKDRGQFPRPRIAHIDTDLRQVFAMHGCRMQVDAVIAALDHLLQEQMGQARCQRPFRAAGKGAVEIAPVGQIAAAPDEAEGVNDRDQQHRPGDPAQGGGAGEPADDLDADDLVAVDRRADKDRRPLVAPMDHLHRQRGRRMVRHHAERDIYRLAPPGRNGGAAQFKRRAQGLLSFWRGCSGSGCGPAWRSAPRIR